MYKCCSKKITLILISCAIAIFYSLFLLFDIGGSGKLELKSDVGLTKLVIAGLFVAFLYPVLSALAVNFCSSVRSWAYGYNIPVWNSNMKLTYAIVWPLVLIPLLFWYLILGIVNTFFK